MPPYIFKMPENTPELTHEGLTAWIEGHDTLDIGTTVHVWRDDEHVMFSLYGTVLARIGRHFVEFTEHGDRHLATTQWLSKIVYDNGAGPREVLVRPDDKDAAVAALREAM